MGRAIIKVSHDEDLYMKFSTIVDDITVIGTREEFLQEGVTEQEMQRADELGSSSYRNRGTWEAEGLEVRSPETRELGFYLLPREKFAEYAHLMLEDKDAEAEALMQRLPDEED